MLQNPQNQPRFLGKQNTTQPGTRPAKLPDSAGERLAGDHPLGVPAETQTAREHDAPGGGGAPRLLSPHLQPQGQTLHPGGRGEPADGGGRIENESNKLIQYDKPSRYRHWRNRSRHPLQG